MQPQHIYRVQWTEEAARIRDSIEGDRKRYLLEGVELLAADPFHEQSRAMNASGTLRKAIVTDGILAEYDVVAEVAVIIFIELFDSMSALRPADPA
ncbi:hypothetical protein [Streptomyces sp. NPDC050738]|uniref:hypothetical protein n=1 Tax=Streptomyces sp. NPDC050738 TaxID=3154744 RepID=UPI003443B4FF